MNSSRPVLRSIALAAASLVAVPLAAQTTAPEPDAAPGAQQVVVTGSLRAIDRFEAPFAAAALDAGAIRRAGPMINLSEALASVPGLVVANRGNYAQDLQIASRGFGARAPFGVRGVRLYTDGIPATMPDGQGQVAHFDLAGSSRIEVLRGPFSVLYGNASGGVIAAFTAPVRERAFEASADAGSFGLRQGRLGVEAPLGAGFELRANVSRMTLDGFRPQSAAERTLANARLGWRGANDTVTLLVSDHRQQAQDPLGLTRAQFDANPRQTAFPATQYDTRKTIAQTQLGANWRHRFDAADGAAFALEQSSLTVYAGQRSVTQWQSIPFAAQGPATSAGGVVDFDRDYAGLDARLDGRAGAATWAAGLAIDRLADARRGYENFTGTGAARVLGVTGRLRRDEDNVAASRDVYGQVRVPLGSPALTATLGARAGQVELRTSDRYVVAGNGDDSGAVRFSFANPVLGLNWKLSDGLALHASAARGFESPTLGELAYAAAGGGGFNTALKAQTSRQFEFGARWRGRGWNAEAVAFDIATDDEIAVASNTGGRSVYQNVGATRRRGLELSGGWQASDELRLRASAAWLDATFRDGYASGSGASAVTVAAGNRLPATARRTAWAEAAWTPRGIPGEFGIEWRAVGDVAVNDVNSDVAAGYAVVNVRWSNTIALSPLDSLELLARIDNVLDRSYAGSVIVNEGNGRFFEPGAPFNGLLSVRWRRRW